ncbi:MAG: PQQ-dependent sugar dehydrogenase [Myxococcales bacterium]|nr:PQQ-dependent sugar dehydrogenase [Myxococcales bacterium]
MRAVVIVLLTVGSCNRDRPEPTPEWGYDARPGNATCLAFARPVANADVKLTPTFTGLSWRKAVWMGQPPGDPDTWWLATQDGEIQRFQNTPGVTEQELVVDLSGLVDDTANEGGLLGLAFHPDFQNNGYVYANYTATGLTTKIVRFTSTDRRTINPGTELSMLSVDQPYNNHNGGALVFGPDGYLYLGMGDGGSGGDPGNHGQTVSTVLGSILRIDVDAGTPYGIPPDNPFALGGGRPEIYAWGFRNPWRFSFDAATGELWAADVGQDKYEEINLVAQGRNYGWRVTEGDDCFNPPKDCQRAGLEEPVAVLNHLDGDGSITGGVVYRGTEIAGFQGVYVFADYVSGRVYGLQYGVGGEAVVEPLLETANDFTHIATDLNNEVFFVDRNRGVLKLEAAGENNVVDEVPRLLSQTGCVNPADASQAGSMMVEFSVAQPFWSDGATKRRWFALPDGTQATVDSDGRINLPVGSIVMKEMALGGQRLETRLLVRHEDGRWGGYTYAWVGQDAQLLEGAATLPVGATGEWAVPSRPDCLQCHTPEWGGVLALSTQQLDGLHVYANGAVANQVDQLTRIGVIETPSDRPGAFPSLGNPAASLDDRARSYLHVNCAYCHFPDGTGGGDLDLRAWTPLTETGLCNEPSQGDLKIPDARIVAPGEPDRSVLYARVATRGPTQMPPLASNVVDEVGRELMREWIAALPGCK